MNIIYRKNLDFLLERNIFKYACNASTKYNITKNFITWSFSVNPRISISDEAKPNRDSNRLYINLY